MASAAGKEVPGRLCAVVLLLLLSEPITAFDAAAAAACYITKIIFQKIIRGSSIHASGRIQLPTESNEQMAITYEEEDIAEELSIHGTCWGLA
jgi:hypothetical protein